MEAVLDFTTPHLLRDDEEYDVAVREIDALVGKNARLGTVDGDRLEFLALLVSEYEDRTLDLGADRTTPQEIVEFMLDQKGYTRGDLAEWLGGRSRVSEFFRDVRTLSKAQILVLRERLGIPADLLIA
jgi:HTH-type transcriptional regulator / antitoxin HigA